MKVSSVFSTSPGPVRPKNEDSVAFWEPEEDGERQQRGSISIVADGVGGHGNGDIASRLAVETALRIFREAPLNQQVRPMMDQIFQEANLALFNSGLENRKISGMATTLSVCVFRDKQLFIGHVGDTRTYLIRQEQIKRLTHDHSYSGLQVKMRLITENEARGSSLRSVLTRSVGAEPVVRYDFKKIKLLRHDRIIQCTDGLYCFMNDSELSEGVDRLSMHEICPYLEALAIRRGTDDNLTSQVVQIDLLEEPKQYQPLSILKKTATPALAPIAPSYEVQPGQTLDNRFLVEAVISRSGMATVFKAKDLKTGKPVALKIPHMQFESDVGFFARFQREAEIGKKLNHPNILKFYEVPEQKHPYIAMELLEGKTLAQLMNEVRPFPFEDARQIASRICDALSHMHENNIVHRDLKPPNVMLLNDGTLRVMDFGIAKSMEARRLTFAGFSSTMGTPDYMAPEQVKGRRGDERTDLYSLGAMLYEMTTGSVPFEGPNPFIVMNSRITGDPLAPRKRNPEIPPELEEIILHAMERDPRMRFASAAAMKADLDDFSKVVMTGRHHHLRLPKMWKTQWRSVRVVVLSALIPILLFGLMLALSHCTRGHHH